MLSMMILHCEGGAMFMYCDFNMNSNVHKVLYSGTCVITYVDVVRVQCICIGRFILCCSLLLCTHT